MQICANTALWEFILVAFGESNICDFGSSVDTKDNIETAEINIPWIKDMFEDVLRL